MSINAIDSKIFNAEWSKQVLPGLTQITNKVRRVVLDVFVINKAFFKVLFFGPWEGFLNNVKSRIELEKNNLQKHDKSIGSEKNNKIRVLTGYKVYSQKDLDRLTKSNKNLQRYQILTVAVKEKDYEKIKNFIMQYANFKDIDNYSVIVSLAKLAKDNNVPKEIRDLINEKLNEVFKKNNIIQKKTKKTDDNSIWKTLAVAVMAVGGFILGDFAYRLYEYNLSKAEENRRIQEFLFIYFQNIFLNGFLKRDNSSSIGDLSRNFFYRIWDLSQKTIQYHDQWHK